MCALIFILNYLSYLLYVFPSWYIHKQQISVKYLFLYKFYHKTVCIAKKISIFQKTTGNEKENHLRFSKCFYRCHLSRMKKLISTINKLFEGLTKLFLKIFMSHRKTKTVNVTTMCAEKFLKFYSRCYLLS